MSSTQDIAQLIFSLEPSKMLAYSPAGQLQNLKKADVLLVLVLDINMFIYYTSEDIMYP